MKRQPHDLNQLRAEYQNQQATWEDIQSVFERLDPRTTIDRRVLAHFDAVFESAEQSVARCEPSPIAGGLRA
jgi:hypothetical protein